MFYSVANIWKIKTDHPKKKVKLFFPNNLPKSNTKRK